MLNVIKKSITILLVCLMITVFSSPIKAWEQMGNIRDEATGAELIAWDQFAAEDEDWAEYEIVGSEPVYGTNMQRTGSLLNLSRRENEAYAIILSSGDSAVVVEAGKGASSPFGDNANKVKVYASPLNYYVSDSVLSSQLKDVTTGQRVNRNEVTSVNLPDTMYINTNNMAIASSGTHSSVTTTYLYNYSTLFEKCTQPPGKTCVPTSHAMALKYLHNRGKITISSSVSNVYTLASTLFNYMKDSSGLCREPNISTGFSNFVSTYVNKVMTTNPTFDDEISFMYAKSKINSKEPLVLMFKDGTPNMYVGSNHATTMVGYKVVINDNEQTEAIGDEPMATHNYAIVVDGNPNPAVEKTMLWYRGYLFGYYIIQTHN